MATPVRRSKVPIWDGELRRYLAGGGISLLGCLLLLVPLFDIWEDLTALSWRLTATLVENVLFVALAGSLVAGGIWLVRSDWETDQVTRISRLTLLSALLVGLLIGWAALLQLAVMNALKPWVLALNGVLVGTVTAFGLSVSTVRARKFETEAGQHRAMNERLELLYQATSDLEAAASRTEAFDVVERAVTDVFESRGFRIVIDGAVVVGSAGERGREEAPPAETVPVGEHGSVELLDGPFERHELVTVELFAAHLSGALDRIEREQAIREERDMLEFVNRTLRHDLMGDLSLLRARLRMLDRNVTFEDESHAEHLSVALGRVEEMDEFVRTMRTYMQSVMDDDHTLEAVALGPILEERVASMREAHPKAEIRCEGVPEVAVLADDLLGRVFVNVLKNAVKHNDSATPRVEIEGELLEDAVRIRIADNGPGISANRREAIFQQGERGTDSDGTGFGLYLVKDVVEGYGGSVRVRDNQPRGTTFEVDLPVASEVA